MNVVPAKEFVPHISPLLEKCPDFVIEREVVKTVADICRSTGCITTTSTFNTVAGTATYEIPMPAGLDGEIVRYAFCDGRGIKPMTHDELVGKWPFDWRESSGTPVAYSFRQHGQLTLFPTPDKEYSIKTDVTVFVNMGSKVVPEMFMSSYLDLVTFGVLARVHQIAGQPYSSVQLAAAYYQQYQSALTDLKIEAAKDYTRTSGRVRYNRI